MFIQTESTPNPSTIKFLPGCAVLENATAQFNSKEDAESSLLATSLFSINNVSAVFFGHDFISVTKSQASDWDIIKTEVLSTIMDHFTSGKPVMGEGDISKAVEDYSEEDEEIVSQIRELIDTRVRPAVAEDGGDIIFRGFKDGIVKLELHGSCSGCPSSTITLKDGIENMLKHYIPEVESVEAI